MEQFIGCDAHKKYSVFVAVNERGAAGKAVRVEHAIGRFRDFLEGLPARSRIAVEAGGHYYWLVDEIQRAGHQAHLANPIEAKKRMGRAGKKTDKGDAEGLAMLLRNGTLPTVWIPPADLRDQRELLRLRLFLVSQRTQWKNRINGALARYNIALAAKDVFTVQGRHELGGRLAELPPHTRESVGAQLSTLDFLDLEINETEERLVAMIEDSVEADLLKTIPYVGRILSMVMALEIGDVSRFPSSAHLASYSGLVPRVHSSGGRTRLGQVCGNVNRYLKWAFVEAANLIVMHQRHLAGSHAVALYQRVKRKQNHAKAAVALARHLAEASYWILKKQQVYQEPKKASKPAKGLYVDARVSAEPAIAH